MSELNKIKQLRSELKKAKKEFRDKKRARDGSLLTRMALTVCSPFENWASKLRYKQVNPEGYEADSMYEDLKKLEKKLDKAEKPLSDENLKMVISAVMALNVIQQTGKGEYAAAGEVDKLLNKFVNYIPATKSIVDIPTEDFNEEANCEPCKCS